MKALLQLGVALLALQVIQALDPQCLTTGICLHGTVIGNTETAK